MNSAFSAYTPRVRPLEYDSLTAKAGCETDSGNDFFGVLAFDQVCIAPHDEEDYNFTQPDSTSYAQGPATPGVQTKPFLTVWTAWFATAGVRIGKVGQTISDTAGDASALYPTLTTATKLSAAFDRLGLLNIAIQKTATLIEVKYYSDTAGTIATTSWSGYSCVLFNAGLLTRLDPSEDTGGVVAYYLRTERPNVIFARFADEGYATERTVMPELRIELTRLIQFSISDNKAVLRAIDALGRDVTLYSPQYSVKPADLAVAPVSGLYFAAGVDAPDQSDNSVLAIAPVSGVYFDATVEPGIQPEDAATLAVAPHSGEYS
jgi:hypothetical protein